LAFLLLTIFPLLFQFGLSMTTLNAQSLRDGLHGGLVRELWGGLTGQIPILGPQRNPNQVHYLGLYGYPEVFGWLSSMGLPVFTILWTALSVSLQLALGLGAALLLWNQHVAFRKTWQVLFILPWAIPEAIGALMWLNIFAPISGWLSLAVKDFGAQNVPFSFLVGWERNPNQTLIILLLASLWYGFPFLMLAASAGLKMLPTEVFDAAAIDGATPWQTFRHVTWPLLTPLLVPAIIIRAIFAFNQFYLFQMFVQFFSGQQYIPVTLSTFSYYLLYRGSEFGVSAILNIITILMLIGFVILFNRWSKAGEGVTYA
jgi:ABC-type sugar transport system permease subunit